MQAAKLRTVFVISNRILIGFECFIKQFIAAGQCRRV